MSDYEQELRFGTFITPSVERAGEVIELAQLSELSGLDLVTVQDHPYQPRHLDTWTLLAVIAAQTSNVRMAPNVANLPLRPPAVLARSVATLDLLSGGRIELGLGAGAFWDAIAAVGGPHLTPGQGVEALAEGIAVIRAMWAADGAAVRLAGVHHRLDGAHPGPAPAHPVEIWLGAYKPRMLTLTGTAADGWLPSMGYADPEALPALNAAIDEAATAAGRSPRRIRRLYNINGRFGRGAGFLAGSARDWAEQLAELTLTTGMSTYLLGTDSPDDIQRFAADVAPAVRELVEAERARPTREPSPSAPIPVAGTAADTAADTAAEEGPPGGLRTAPTPDDGIRLSDEQPWDERTRPTGPTPDPTMRFTAVQEAAAQHLVDIHDGLRGELERLRDLVEQVAEGKRDAGAARSLINRMSLRQNNWTLGAYCASYCRIVTGHHSLEDRAIFPHLAREDPRLAPVLDRLDKEHHAIADVLERIDRALVALVEEPDGLPQLRAAVDLLTDTMRSHLAYEERELLEPLARLGYY